MYDLYVVYGKHEGFVYLYTFETQTRGSKIFRMYSSDMGSITFTIKSVLLFFVVVFFQ